MIECRKGAAICSLQEGITIDTVKRFYDNKEEGLKVAEETIKDLQERENSYALSSRAGKMDWDRGNSGIRTLGLGISAEYIQKGFIDFRGKTVESPEQLALLAQAYRDPRYETLRIVCMKGDIHNCKIILVYNAAINFIRDMFSFFLERM